MAEQKFKVAPGCSFVGNGKIYNEGDKITASVFGENEKGKARFKSFQEGKNPKIVPATVAVDAEDKKDNSKRTREELEKIALEKELFKESFTKKISSLKDDELLKLVIDAGF